MNCEEALTTNAIVDKATLESLKAQDRIINKRIDTMQLGAVDMKKDLLLVDSCCTENREKNVEQDKRIDEINANICLLKGKQTEQDNALKKLKPFIVNDQKYNDFNNWYNNVFLPNKHKFKPGDIYINSNPNIGAVNNTYIYVGEDNANPNPDPLNPNTVVNIGGWVFMPSTKPADIIEILGINPIKVDHPYKDKYIISINPDELATFIEKLPNLDLSKVNLKLGKIKEVPVYENSPVFKLNITVEGKAILNDLHVSGDTTLQDVHINGDIYASTIKGPLMTFEESVQVNENINVNNQITTQHFHSTGNAHFNNVDFDGDIRIPTKDNQCAVYKGIGDKYVSINQTIFQPSFAKFVITERGEKHGDRARTDAKLYLEWDPSADGEYRSRLIPLGGNMAWGSILGQAFLGQIWDMVPMSYNTPDIERIGNTGIILIKNSGVYDISYIYNFSQSRNVWANRAGLALVRGSTLQALKATNGDFQIEDLVDNKWEGSSTKDDANGQHTGPGSDAFVHTDHIYSGSDYTYLDKVEKWSKHLGMSIQSWSASGSTIVEIPCGESMAIIPYIKPSIAGANTDLYPEWQNKAWVLSKNGKWDTGAFSQITIKKVANSTTNVKPLI